MSNKKPEDVPEHILDRQVVTLVETALTMIGDINQASARLVVAANYLSRVLGIPKPLAHLAVDAAHSDTNPDLVERVDYILKKFIAGDERPARETKAMRMLHLIKEALKIPGDLTSASGALFVSGIRLSKAVGVERSTVMLAVNMAYDDQSPFDQEVLEVLEDHLPVAKTEPELMS